MSTSDPVLTAAPRRNLLRLQTTKSSIDVTLMNLAAGRSVRCALNSPAEYSDSVSLLKRPEEAHKILDRMAAHLQKQSSTVLAYERVTGKSFDDLSTNEKARMWSVPPEAEQLDSDYTLNLGARDEAAGLLKRRAEESMVDYLYRVQEDRY